MRKEINRVYNKNPKEWLDRAIILLKNTQKSVSEIEAIATLTVMGNAIPQLKVHIHAGLNVGCTKEEILEVIMQMSTYGGFPCALNGLFVAKEVFNDKN